MMPVFPNFKTLSIDDKSWIEQITDQFPTYSDHHFAGLFSYDVDDAVQVCSLDNNFVMKSFDYLDGKPFVSFLGNSSVIRTTEILLDFSVNEGLEPALKLIPEDTVEKDRNSLSEKYFIREDRDNFDYIVPTQAIVEIGSSNTSYGKHINRFQRKYGSVEYRELDVSKSSEIDKIFELFDNWRLNKGLSINDYEVEYKALNKLLAYEDSFRLLNYGFFDGGKMIGFTINELSYDKTYVGHFGKAGTEYKGVYQYMEYVTALEMNKLGFTQVNLEQDMGLPGLRKTKSSWPGVTFLKKYSISKK